MKFKSLLPAYDGFICDLWGVIYEGDSLFPGIIECLKVIQAQNKPFVFLSNATKSAGAMKKVLAEKGLTPDLYTDLMTAGEFFYADLMKKKVPLLEGKKLPQFFIIDEVGDSFIDPQHKKLCVPVSTLCDADAIVVCNIDTHKKNYIKYEGILSEALSLKIPMICVNGDKDVFHGVDQLLRPGYMAHDYAAQGGKTYVYGKPDVRLLKQTLKMLGPIKHEKIFALGDSLDTDILGANQLRLDSALVLPPKERRIPAIQYETLPILLKPKYCIESLGL